MDSKYSISPTLWLPKNIHRRDDDDDDDDTRCHVFLIASLTFS